MKKLLTLLICVVALGAGALLGLKLSGDGEESSAPIPEVISPPAGSAASGADARADQTSRGEPQEIGAGRPELVVYKSATCGCCGDWIAHLREHGFAVTVHDSENMERIKQEAAVPRPLWSCHTAFAGDYVIEGHVPAAEIHRLLDQQPVAAGLAVPGMPLGSPGMEMGDRRDAYQVVLFQEDGSGSAFAHYLGDQKVVRDNAATD